MSALTMEDVGVRAPEQHCTTCDVGLVPLRAWVAASQETRAMWRAFGLARSGGYYICHSCNRAPLRLVGALEPETAPCNRCGIATPDEGRVCLDCRDVVTPEECATVWADDNAWRGSRQPFTKKIHARPTMGS